MDRIDVSPDDLVLPGDCLGGAVLDLGIQVGTPGLRNYHVVVRQTRQTVDIARRDGMQYGEMRRHLVINCCHEATRDRLRRVLAAGERCEACGGWGKSGPKMSAFKWTDDGMVRCSACNGTGYTRPPHDLGYFIDAEIAGRITPQVAAGLWWCSALRVEAGLGPVVGPATCVSEDASALLDSHRLSAAHYALYSPNRDHILLPLPDRIARLRLEG